MFKNLFYLSLILLTIKINSQNQHIFTYKFVYNLTYQPNNKDVDTKLSEQMILFRNGERSLFISRNNFLNDSLVIEERKGNISLDPLEYPKTKFYYKILKDFSKDSITVYNEIFLDNFKYTESKKAIKWKITSHTTKINGLKCQKAVTYFSGRYYDAWFTNEIPISDGPYKFSGLPGLIVKISDSKKHYIFELVSQSKVNQPYPNLIPNKRLYITNKKTFFKKQKEFKDNIVTKISQSGFTLDKKHVKKVKERNKKRNNPIELGDAWYLDH
ncbi:hypothetical protein BTO06_17400 [Tenacibaculum sp. SZ-18]|uniref:GLPGLI family protein n=1 Tax=Tenacibaculum sp. SZ-18 TaxID=754423 RepID=UPI000C2CF449|nr:GLPGLI family protein [Tenacibaculum sp. SZ-18]AUC16809.1 hypothetical protein BTO06_17400 [Tenacibaculum sp. SZ-18]